MPSNPAALNVMGASHVAATIVAFRDALVAHCEVINDLNVYPVPDGDTGSNMSLTLGSVVEELERADADMASVCKAISHGSFMGGRGNSGVILSQILMGATKVLMQNETASAADWNEALAAAATAAYGAVPKPVEGTILTVVREVSEACAALDPSVGLVEFFETARDAGAVSLANTPNLLSQLADAGVVDAGGAGFLLLIDAALTVIDRRPLPKAPTSSGPAIFLSDGVEPGDDDHTDISDLKYEVMFFLDAPDDVI
ncbi:MAG: DAK2 domain-containing protein, partial [Acidimicrobiales bacterium]